MSISNTNTQNGFIPKHTHPFTLEEAMLLEINILVQEVSRLRNSIAHLQETQSELRSFLEEDEEGDEDGEIGLAIEENEVTIASQKERIQLVIVALTNKVGKDALAHYGLQADSDTDPTTKGSEERVEVIDPGPEMEMEAEVEVEEGIHL